jgi:hypothetical protein
VFVELILELLVESGNNFPEKSVINVLAIFLVRGARTQKKGLKTHLSKVSGDNAPQGKSRA